MGERTSSPAEVARELGVPVTKLAHHVTVLIETGHIELVDTKPNRGALEHFYRATVRAEVSDAISALLPRPVREGIRDKMLGAILDNIGGAIDAGTIDARSDRHISWMRMTLDEEGWTELIALKARQLELEKIVEAKAAGRLADGEEGGEPVTVFTAALGFEAP
jgi:hypothetical protein